MGLEAGNPTVWIAHQGCSAHRWAPLRALSALGTQRVPHAAGMVSVMTKRWEMGHVPVKRAGLVSLVDKKREPG